MQSRLIRLFVPTMCGLLVVLLVSATFAQGPPNGRGGQRGGGFGRMGGGMRGPMGAMRGGGSMGLTHLLNRKDVQKELKLSEQQKTQLTEMQDAFRKEMQKRWEEMRKMSEEERQKLFSQPPEKFQEELAKRDKETTAKLAKILSSEQFKRLKQLQLQQARVMALSWPVVVEEIGLTEDQKAQLKKIGEDAWKQMSSMRPPRGQRRGEGDRNQGRDRGDRDERRKQRQEMRKKMQEMRAEIEKKSIAVLTADQKAKFGAMMGEPFKFDESETQRGWGRPRGEGRRGQGGRQGQGRRGQGRPQGTQPGGVVLANLSRHPINWEITARKASNS